MLLNEKLNILLIGSGGREHAIASSIYNEAKLNKLYCAFLNSFIKIDSIY